MLHTSLVGGETTSSSGAGARSRSGAGGTSAVGVGLAGLGACLGDGLDGSRVLGSLLVVTWCSRWC